MKINREQLQRKLEDTTSQTPVVVHYGAEPSRLRKKGNPYFGNVIKHVVAVGTLLKEFTPTEEKTYAKYRAWGTPISGTPLIRQRGMLYLEMQIQGEEVVYTDKAGATIPLEEIKPYLEPDTAKPVKTYRLDHIEAIQLGKETYEIE